MPLPDKTAGIAEVIARIPDGASIMIGGFGVPGTPFCLIQELVRQGQRNLTIIKNDANEVGMGVDWLLENGQVSMLIASHIGLNRNAIRLKNEGAIVVEFVPQGILAERVRAAGAGLLGFVTDIGVGTSMSDNKLAVSVNGVAGVLEPALRADFALIHAERSDTFGNLRFSAAARNFNPMMGMAAAHTIVEAEAIVPLGAISPDDVHLPGPFVNQVIAIPELLKVYGVVQR